MKKIGIFSAALSAPVGLCIYNVLYNRSDFFKAPLYYILNIFIAIIFAYFLTQHKTDEQSETINNFSNKIYSLEKINKVENIEIVLSKDATIEGVVIPKDTTIHFKKASKKEISDNWCLEADFNL